MKTYQVSTIVLSLLLGNNCIKNYYRPPSYSQISHKCGCNCEAVIPANECVSCCDTGDAPAAEEDPYEAESDKLTNTIWESVSKVEDRDVRRDNAARIAVKLKEIEEEQDKRETQ